MATGSGKTIVMATLIAWQVSNKVTYPQDARFSKHIFVVAPGLTVKSRLQVLEPAAGKNPARGGARRRGSRGENLEQAVNAM
jgi:type III restriction enzyme